MKSIREHADDLVAGRTTSVELVEQTLQCVDTYRQAGGAAYISVDADAALLAADASDRARAAGHVPSLLAGLPVSIKDNIDVRGQVTAAGSTMLAGSAPAMIDAPTVARLRDAGAILVGRTNMSEFAFSGLGLNPHYGTPTNPFDPDRIAGGSTSGGAVSVALGMAVAALGTDTGGSIRIPSAFCGLTGFKPTAGRISLTGIVPLSRTLDCAGPLGRTVDCCAIVDAVLSGETLDTEEVPLTLDEDVERGFDDALGRLEKAGAMIERFSFPELLELPTINGSGGFAAAEAWAWHRLAFDRNAGRYDPRVASRIARGSHPSAAD